MTTRFVRQVLGIPSSPIQPMLTAAAPPVRSGAAVRSSAFALGLLALAGCATASAPAGPPPPTPAQIDSIARVTADSVARVVADSLARVVADSLARAAADSAARAAALPPARSDVRVCAGGDVAFGTNLSTAWRGVAAGRWGVALSELPGPDALARRLREILPGADIVLLNVEGAIGDGPAPSKCGPGSTACYAIRMPPAAAPAFAAVAPDATVVGNVANNHSRDAGTPGFTRTGQLLTDAGVLVTGADTLATPIAIGIADTVGVLGFATSPGTATDLRDLDAVRRHVARAAERYGRVIVTAHLGAEGVAAQRTRDEREIFYNTSRGNPVAFARTAVEAGAAMVIGHGPHVLRAIEWRDSSLVAYSLGNLLTFGPFSTAEPLNRGALVCATLAANGGVTEATLTPTVQRVAGRLERDATGRALTLIDSLSRLDFPRTGARVTPDGALTRPPD